MKTKLGLLLVMLSLAVWCDDSTDAEQPTDPKVVYKQPPSENQPESTVTDWTNRRFNRAVDAATKAQQRSDDRSQRLLENPKNPDPYKQRPATGEPEIESITNTIGMTLNKIPAGTFMMGSPETPYRMVGHHTQRRSTTSITGVRVLSSLVLFLGNN